MSKRYEGRPYHVVMFVSRNKDNSNLQNFKQRTKTFLTQKFPDELKTEFNEFCERGLCNELSRFYVSVNARKHDEIIKSLQHYLIDHQDMNLSKINSLIGSLSMKRGTALTKKFLFDFDDDPQYIGMFVDQVEQEIGNSNMITVHETVNGYAVVTDQGFDTRDLLKKWKKVELKRDGMLFVKAQKKLD